jgi:CubicO group peptidase (beta-lactamase class C family)
MPNRLPLTMAMTSVLISLSITFPVATSADPSTSSSQVDGLFANWDLSRSPGCAVAVMKNGRIAYERGYGMADLDHGVKITPATVFHVGSIAKQFTAFAVLMLARDGKLSLDDPLRKYVPEVGNFGAPITLRELLHHTSGLRDWQELLVFDGWRIYGDVVTEQDVLDVISRQKDLNFPPGSEFSYSNTGYSLLANVVARVSGKSFPDFTVAQIFRPLGMEHTHFRDNHAQTIKNLARGYRQRRDESFEEADPNLDTVGCTNLMTTVEDLSRWDENFYSARGGGPTVVKQMTEPGKLSDGTQIIYGAGLFLGPNAAEHSGGDARYGADMIRFPAQHLSVAVLCNLASIDVMGLTHRVGEIYGGKLPASSSAAEPSMPKRVKHTPSPKELLQFVGLYRSPEIQIPYNISADGSQLSMHALKIGAVPMVPIDRDEFSCTQSEPSNVQRWRVSFIRDTRGHVSGFLINTDYLTRNLRFIRVTTNQAP